MDVSPETPPTVNHRSPPPPLTLPPNGTPPATLASMLADCLQEVDSLRREVTSQRNRAEKAERLASSLKAIRNLPAPDPANPNPTMHAEAIALITAAEERARAAEAARDDAEARRAQLTDNWGQLSQYLSQLDAASVDARAGFARVVDGGAPITFPPIPTLGGRPTRGRAFATPFPPLPPHPSTTGTRRPRTPSVDGYGMPPNKKSRGEYDSNAMYMDTPRHHHHGHAQPPAAPRMILPPGEHSNKPSSSAHPHGRTHSRSSSRSSSSSLSVDEMLLATTTDGAQANGATNGNGNVAEAPQHHLQHPQHAQQQQQHQQQQQQQQQQHLQPPPPQQQHRRPRSHHTHAQIYAPPPFESHDAHAVRRAYTADYPPHDAYRAAPKQSAPQTQQGVIVPPTAPPPGSVGPHAQPGQAREFQTHIFAPVVTGAPVKKSKFSATNANAAANSSNATASSSPSLAAAASSPSLAAVDASPAPGTIFPATNAQGQRICRQCGMAGRYKDGKCVEKWGPGPMGPGTVCDRCRKKMKRVERRGTLADAQQQAQAQAQAQAQLEQKLQQQQQHQQQQAQQPPQRPSSSQSHSHSQSQSHAQSGSQPRSQPIHRTDTLPAHAHAHSHSHTRPPPSPGPSIALLDDFPTSAARNSAHSNGHGHGHGHGKKGSPAGLGLGLGRPGGKRSSRSPGDSSVVDVDAEGEEADEDADADAEIEGMVGEVLGDGDVAMRMAGAGAGGEEDGEGDAEMDLLEAVDAAEEANGGASVSGSGGSSKEE
ncbi:hypothetical protein H0H81_011026 [Sphagnurus paluster]|uniref:GATA-type domain-containing protein n=1 Tax=Sphagnurus paluster TaxID=117069 RepID=A0A9P7GHN4_9AGAR|nr:hypothetical protein H0H81_011026 [Sphagnurus paluster]